jgi:hypothetical protein
MSCIQSLTFLLFFHSQSSIATVPAKAALICEDSARRSIDPLLALAVIQVESRGKHLPKRNKTDDIGIFQLHCPEDSSSSWCRQCNQKKLSCNIRSGIDFMYYIKRRWKNSKSHWIRYYNYGSSRHWKKVLNIYQIYRNQLSDG